MSSIKGYSPNYLSIYIFYLPFLLYDFFFGKYILIYLLTYLLRCLWDTSAQAFKENNKKQEAWKSISQRLGKHG